MRAPRLEMRRNPACGRHALTVCAPAARQCVRIRTEGRELHLLTFPRNPRQDHRTGSMGRGVLKRFVDQRQDQNPKGHPEPTNPVAEYRVPSTEYRVPSTEYRVPSTETSCRLSAPASAQASSSSDRLRGGGMGVRTPLQSSVAASSACRTCGPARLARRSSSPRSSALDR
jgi:hypothetical protein